MSAINWKIQCGSQQQQQQLSKEPLTQFQFKRRKKAAKIKLSSLIYNNRFFISFVCSFLKEKVFPSHFPALLVHFIKKLNINSGGEKKFSLLFGLTTSSYYKLIFYSTQSEFKIKNSTTASTFSKVWEFSSQPPPHSAPRGHEDNIQTRVKAHIKFPHVMGIIVVILLSKIVRYACEDWLSEIKGMR